MRKSLFGVMFGDAHKTFDRLAFVGGFGVQIAEHIQRAEIARVVFNHPFVFIDRRPNLALGKKSFGIAHRFYFVETHLFVD